MSRASFSTCSTSHLDLSDNNRELYGCHHFEEGDSSLLTPYNKCSNKIENNCSASSSLLSSEKKNNDKKINLNDFDAENHLLDGNLDNMIDCKKRGNYNKTHNNSDGNDDNDGVGVENVTKDNAVKSVNSSNENEIILKKNDKNSVDNGDKNDRNNEIIANSDNNENKCMMNVNNSKRENRNVLTDHTANSIIIPFNVTKNDKINNVRNSGEVKIDGNGMIIGHCLNDIDNNKCNSDNDNDNNYHNNHDKNIKNYRNNNINNDNNIDKDDDNDDDDGDDGWKSMPSSNDFTATGIETMLNNENNDCNDNISLKVSKKKKTEKNRNKSTTKNENENENKNKNKLRNKHFDESTYDLYTDGTHSKILAYRFERVLLVETFKENAGN